MQEGKKMISLRFIMALDQTITFYSRTYWRINRINLIQKSKFIGRNSRWNGESAFPPAATHQFSRNARLKLSVTGPNR